MEDVLVGGQSEVREKPEVVERGARPAVTVIEEVRKPGIVKRIASILLTIELIILATLALCLFGGAPFGINTYGNQRRSY